MRFLLCFSLMFFAQAKTTKAKKSRSPASGFQKLVAVKQLHGKVVRYEVKLKDSQYTVLMGTTTGERALRQITAEQVDDLDEQFRNLPTVEKLPPECARSRVDVTVVDEHGTLHKDSCLGYPSITEPAYSRFVKALEDPF